MQSIGRPTRERSERLPFRIGPVVLDTEGVDIWPIVDKSACDNGVDATLLLALCKAESGLDPKAQRWGARTKEAKAALAQGAVDILRDIIRTEAPDVSFGLTQQIIPTAGELDIGDGSWSLGNVILVKAKLFNRVTSIDCCARLLSQICSREDVQNWAWPELAACVVYNCGRLPPVNDDWWYDFSTNVDNYREALEWASRIVGG